MSSKELLYTNQFTTDSFKDNVSQNKKEQFK